MLFIRCFLFRADAPSPLLQGRCCPFFFFPGGLFLASYVFFLVGFSLLVINSYLSKKKKTNLIQLTLFFLSFVMMSGLGSQASIM